MDRAPAALPELVAPGQEFLHVYGHQSRAEDAIVVATDTCLRQFLEMLDRCCRLGGSQHDVFLTSGGGYYGLGVEIMDGPANMGNVDFLHVYAPFGRRNSMFLVASMRSVELLRTVVSRALQNGHRSYGYFQDLDGCQFDVYVLVVAAATAVHINPPESL